MQDWSGGSKTQLRAVNLKSLRAVERKPSPLSSCCRHSETVAKKRQEGGGVVEKYLTLRQTFFPAGSSSLEEDQEQLSRALRAPRRRFISTEGHNKPWHRIFFLLPFLTSIFCPFELLLYKSKTAQREAGSPLLSGLHPLCFAAGRRLAAPAQP